MRKNFSETLRLIKLLLNIIKITIKGGNILMDKGIKKTEFISYLLSVFSLTLQMLKSANPEMYAVIIGILTGIYIICRTIYKLTSTKIDDKIIEYLEKIVNSKNL